MTSIRHVAICVFQRGTRILVGRAFDEVKNEEFFRPLGGAIEFGETAVDAVRREILEELRAEISDPVQIGVLENIFTFAGQPGHEFVVVFDAEFTDSSLYNEARLPLFEEGWGGEAFWLDLAEPLPAPLYPDGLSALLASAI